MKRWLVLLMAVLCVGAAATPARATFTAPATIQGTFVITLNIHFREAQASAAGIACTITVSSNDTFQPSSTASGVVSLSNSTNGQCKATITYLWHVSQTSLLDNVNYSIVTAAKTTSGLAGGFNPPTSGGLSAFSANVGH